MQLGDSLPRTEVIQEDGTPLRLTDLVGKPLILYFYPKDDTPGCTQQACDFRDSWDHLQGLGAHLLGLSRDSPESHQQFRQKHHLNFPLASDISGETCKAFGVWVEKSMYGKTYWGIERSTFLFDRHGKLVQVWTKVKVPGHVEEVRAALAALPQA